MKIAFKLPMSMEIAASLLKMAPEDAGRVFQAAMAHYLAEGAKALPEAEISPENAIAEWCRLIDVSRARAAAGRAGASRYVENRFAPNKNNFAPGKQAEALNEAVKVEGGFDALAGLEAFM